MANVVEKIFKLILNFGDGRGKSAKDEQTAPIVTRQAEKYTQND